MDAHGRVRKTAAFSGLRPVRKERTKVLSYILKEREKIYVYCRQMERL